MSKIVNLSEAAQISGKTLNTVKQWATEAGDSWVIERGNKSRPWRIDVTAMQEWRERRAVDEARISTPIASNTNIVLDGIFDRLESWREIYPNSDQSFGDMPIQEFSKAIGTDISEILRWLRMGMPYHEEGDWETGEGFVIKFAWFWDWSGFVTLAIASEGANRGYHGQPYSILQPHVGGA